MINNFSFRNLRNAEYYQFMVSAFDLFAKSGFVRENFGYLYDSMGENLRAAETALAAERKNEKIREKNEADRYRDRLHSKLFNYLKSILYDDRDARFDDAQVVMRVVKEAGNPTRLAENAQSAMMTTLGNRLEPYRSQLEAIDAHRMVEEMLEANRRFIVVERELREMLAAQKLSDVPQSMTAVRRQIDPAVRAIITGVNVFTKVPSKKEECKELIAEMNVLTARYDALLSARKREKKEKPTAEPTVCDECKRNEQ
jgi:hypothetical protein